MKYVKSIVLFSAVLVLFSGCSVDKESTKKTNQPEVESTVKKKDTSEKKSLSNLTKPAKKTTDSSNKQVDDIESIQYRVSNETGVLQGVDINFKTNEKIVFKKEKTKENIAVENVSGIAAEDLKTVKIDKGFKEKLFKTNFNNWEEKYENKEIMDGTMWEIVVKYTDGTGKVSYGINAKPDSFATFESLIFET
ncbi:hypothetical protein [Vagococcus silagei]|uniref:DUF5067 domain-containing protein n=1 Tax=Vagococcus silagei TaxID=2508885 RepID=A0A4S3AZX2_9ENTE|nr:hypothetical protein [Vagococcus silagei]THB60301.1 hypothetical protein ESZ54_11165 [Vagococcus silagei]